MKVKNWLLLLISIFISFFFIPWQFVNNPSSSLDPSWQVAIGSALKTNLIFGKDFIFTYGPLGFLWTRLSIGVSSYVFLIADLFVLANMIFIFYSILTKNHYLSVSACVVIAILLLWINDISIHLLLIFIFYIYEYLNTRKDWILANLIALGTLLFFIKLSTGLIPILFIIVFLAISRSENILKWSGVLAVLTCYVLSIVISAYILNTHVPDYIRNGLSIIDGYNDAMSLERLSPNDFTNLKWGIICILFLIIPFFVFLKKIILDRYTLGLYFIIFISAYVFFKVAFTRLHDAHFFSFIIPLASLLSYFTRVERTKTFIFTLIPIIVICVYHETSINGVGKLTSYSPAQIMGNRISQLANYPGNHPTYQGDQNNYRIPEALLKEISKETVDVMPWDISPIVYNELNYKPRPIPQSYSAYTERLDELNADFIRDSGPAFILFAPKTIDNRYYSYDEPRTKFELIRNYRVADVQNNWDHLLMEKLTEPVSYKKTVLSETDETIGIPIKLEETETIQLAYPQIEYSILGKVYRFFFWAPELIVTFELNDNSQRTFRYLKNSGYSGIIVNKYIDDFGLFSEYLGRLSRNVKKITFSSNSPWAFKEKFHFKLEEVIFEHEKRAMAERNKPIELDQNNLIVSGEDEIRFNFEEFTVDKTLIYCFGWSFIQVPGFENLRPSLLFEASDHSLIFEFQGKSFRPDVKSAFEAASDSSGFSLITSRSFLKKAIYKVSIAYLDKNNNIVLKKAQNAIVENNQAGKIDLGAFEKALLFKAQITPPVQIEGDFLSGIDELKYVNGFLKISGWVAVKNEVNDFSNDSLYVVLRSKEGKRFKASPKRVKREDVANHFKNPSMLNSGFDDLFKIGSMSKGEYDVILSIEDFAHNKTLEKVIDKMRIGEVDHFELTPFSGDVAESGSVKLEIDKLEDNGEFLKIEGWAFVVNEIAIGEKVSVVLKQNNAVFRAATNPVQRPDVASYFKDSSLSETGFEATILKKGLKKGKHEIGLYIKFDDNRKSALKWTGNFLVVEP